MKQKIIIELDENIEDISKWFIEDAGDYLINAVKNSTSIPEDATNGDVIKMMFPNGDLHDYDYYNGYVIYELNYQDFRFDKNWWNAPYERGMR